MAKPTVMRVTLLGCESVTIGGTGIRFIKNRPCNASGPALEYARNAPKGMFHLATAPEPPKPSPPKNIVLKGNEPPKPPEAKEKKPPVLPESKGEEKEEKNPEVEEEEEKPEAPPKKASDSGDETGGKFSTRRRANRTSEEKSLPSK